MSDVRFDDKTVVITDASSLFGRASAVLLASRGANLVLNHYLQPGFKYAVNHVNTKTAPVKKINFDVGRAVVTSETPANGEKIIETAISTFGAVHALISNATFRRLSPATETGESRTWDAMQEIDIMGSYKCAKAVWPHFRKQGHGRIICVESLSEPLNSESRIAQSAATMAHLGLMKTLAKEGAKYNISTSVVTSQAQGDATKDGKFGEDDALSELLAALVAVLIQSSDKTISGSLFEVNTLGLCKTRWERAMGSFLNPELSFSPGALLAKWGDVRSFSQPSYPTSAVDFTSLLPRTLGLKRNQEEGAIDFKGKVAVVTGAGAGLGRCYALAFGELGAAVVVNDRADPSAVVEEIRKGGSRAIASVASVENGDAIIKTAIETYGRVDILINNAGFVRDKAFVNMDSETWSSIIKVHLHGTYSVTKAAWPHFLKQGYGRVVNTTSTSGIYGNFGQSNYATAKLGILGLSDAFAQEGIQNNILVNTIAPVASTGGLATALSGTSDVNNQLTFKPQYITPLVLLLSSDAFVGTPSATGGLYEAGCGWQAETRFQKSCGYQVQGNAIVCPESLVKQWDVISRFASPRSPLIVQSDMLVNRSMLESIEIYKATKSEATTYTYSDTEIILYNLSVGARRTDLHLVYEGSKSFQALPTFGVIPFFSPSVIYHNADLVPRFRPTQSVLGEHYLEIRKYPIPVSGTLTSTSKLLDVIDKGSAAVSITGYITRDSVTGEDIFYNEVTFFMRGSGGFGGQSKAQDRGAATRRYAVPLQRSPDAIAEYKTSEEQAALYRLTGDRMAMHIDPDFSKQGGYPDPILHGACFMGIAAKHVYEKYGAYRSVKVRFAGTVVPGQTLMTEMWRERGAMGDLVLFQMRVVETGNMCIVGGGAELIESTVGGSRL